MKDFIRKTMIRKTKNIPFAFYILLIFLFVSCIENDDEKIASVGDKDLNYSEIEFIYPELYSQNNYETQKKILVNKWIDTELLYQAAKEHKPINSERIEQKTKYYKKQLIIQNYLDSVAYKNIQVTDSEIFEQYQQNKGLYIISKPTAVVVNYLTNNKEEGEKTRNILVLGDKKELNSLNSKHNINQQLVEKENLTPKIEKEIFSSYNKKIIGPIKIKDGFIVIKILKKLNRGEQIPFTFVKNKIKEEILLEKRNNLYKNLIKKLRKTNKVKIYEKNN